MERIPVKGVLALAAALCLAGGVYLAYMHEPDNGTVEFSTDDDYGVQKVTSSARTYLFQYTGKGADAVHWDFGDGTEADAFEVYKTYSEAGTYDVVCTAMNFGGSRTSGLPVTIVEKEYGFLDGYSDEVLLLSLGAMFMVLSFAYGRTHPSVAKGRRGCRCPA